MKSKIKILILSVFVSLLISGCEKGDKGDPGPSGTTNVSAHTYSVLDWSSNSSCWFTNLTVSEITSDNINSISVQVYFGKGDGVWMALPTTVVASTDYYMGYSTAVGIVQIQWYYNGVGIGNSPNTFFGFTSQYKIVLIPNAAKKANPNVDLKDYNAVKAAFDLKN